MAGPGGILFTKGRREMPHIWVDADACPVKNEICRVPGQPGVTLAVVNDHFDAADDHIVAHAEPGDIVVTTDIPLAARCLERQARVLDPKGRVHTEESIGAALANREFLAQMREHGMMEGGPAPFGKKDRSRFLQRLDELARR